MNGIKDRYVIKNNKKLRYGYTTGTCAAAAAAAAARILFLCEMPDALRITTPSGAELDLEVRDPKYDGTYASCAIKKDAGDDPDVTDGLLVYAKVRKCERTHAAELIKIFMDDLAPSGPLVGITAGEGVGRVTLPGLTQPVGAFAINETPRRMITKEILKVCEKAEYTEGIEVIISVPGGRKASERTFNPRLGIEGGISILGTSGIVEPMSEAAVIDTISLQMRQKASDGRKYMVITPGNYGMEYLDKSFPFGPEDAVKCSNYVGNTIDMAVNLGLSGILFVSHIGKFIKVAGGIMNTHSHQADARLEILACAALRAGISGEDALRILDAVTTDEGLNIIGQSDCRDEVMKNLSEKTHYYLSKRAQRDLKCEAIVFSNKYGELYRTGGAGELIESLIRERKERKEL